MSTAKKQKKSKSLRDKSVGNSPYEENTTAVGFGDIQGDALIGLSGSSTDWSSDNSDAVVEKQKRYSKNILMQQQTGSPDFDTMISE